MSNNEVQTMKTVDVALHIAELGFPVIPCREKDEINKEGKVERKAKSPLISGWPEKATQDPEQIREWWTKWPNAMTGTPTGKTSGLFVIDLDIDKIDGPNGDTIYLKTSSSRIWFEEFLKTIDLSLDNIPYHITPSGGLHIPFFVKEYQLEKVDIIPNRANLMPGFDIRTTGGQIIMPPSRLISYEKALDGGIYIYKNNNKNIKYAELDDRILDKLIELYKKLLKKNNTNTEKIYHADLTSIYKYTPNRFPYEEINRLALNNQYFLNSLFPEATFGSTEINCADIYGNKGHSFNINRETGKWIDNATGETGYDIIELVAKRFDLKNHAAAEWIAKEIGYPLQQTAARSAPRIEQSFESPSKPANKEETTVIAKELEGLSEEDRHKKLLAIDDDKLDCKQLEEKYNLSAFSAAKLSGPAPQEEYLVDGTFTMGAAHLFAADGGLGKGMLFLELAVTVAMEEKPLLATFCDRPIMQHNRPVVIIAAEDTRDDFHRRLDSMGLQKPKNLFLVALPNCSGGSSLFKQTSKGQYTQTALWNILSKQICELKPALVILDPLAALVEIETDSDNTGASFISRKVAGLAQQSGACIIIQHHTAKNANSQRDRTAIRGVTGLINGVRSSAQMWRIDDKEAKGICAKIGEKYEPDKILRFRVTKCNFRHNRKEEILMRMSNGRIIAITEKIADSSEYTEDQLKIKLTDAISDAAKNFSPYKATGEGGLYKQRGDLPEPLNTMARHKLEKMVSDLIEEGKIVKGSQVGYSSKCWLDVPDGPVARGEFKKMEAGARSYKEQTEEELFDELSTIYPEPNDDSQLISDMETGRKRIPETDLKN